VPIQPPLQWVTGLFLGAKRPGRGVDHQLRAFMACSRVKFKFTVITLVLSC